MSCMAPTQPLTQGISCLVTRATTFFFKLYVVTNYHGIILYSKPCNYIVFELKCPIVCMQIYGEFNGFLSRDTAGDAQESVETI
jgi:hypothetical protein